MSLSKPIVCAFQVRYLLFIPLLWSFILSAVAQDLTLDWVKQYSGTMLDIPTHEMAVDPSGNVYTAGLAFNANIDFDPGPASQNLSVQGDMYLSKMDALGNYEWAFTIGDLHVDAIYDLVANDSGVYVIGEYDATPQFSNSFDFDPGPDTTLVYFSGLFIARFTPGGDLHWLNPLEGASFPSMPYLDEEYPSIALDDYGNLYVTGSGGVVDMDAGPAFVPFSGGFFLAKYDVNGNYHWVEDLGSNVKPTGIAISGDGDVYCTGKFGPGTIDFDPGPGTDLVTVGTTENIFVSKFDSTGSFYWATQYEVPLYVRPSSIAVDTAGNAIFTGLYWGDTDFDPGVDTFMLNNSNFDENMYVSKLTSNGDFEWATQIENDLPLSDNWSRGLVTDVSGNVYACGFFYGTRDFDPGVDSFNIASNNFTYDPFVQVLNPDGEFIMARTLNGPGFSKPTDLVIDQQGSLYMTGYFSDSADFDFEAGTNYEKADTLYDIFIQKFTPNFSFSTVALLACDSLVSPSGNQVWYSSGTFHDTIPNAVGYDSLMTINLTIDGFWQQDSVFACTDYTWPVNGQTYSTSGIYSDTFTTVNGCDSVHVLLLAIGASINIDSVSACSSFFWPLTGITYDSSGVDTAFFASSSGCDSSTVLHVTINQESQDTIVVSACDSLTWNVDGETYTASGLYSATFTDSSGCDSTIWLDLTINEVDTSIIQSYGPDQLEAQATNATFQWLDCDANWAMVLGETNALFVPLDTHAYAVEITQNSCVDTSRCSVPFDAVAPGTNISEELTSSSLRVFPNPSKGVVHLQITSGDPFDMSVDVLSIDGRLIDRIGKRTYQTGTYGAIWNQNGSAAEGTYLLVFKTTSGTQVKRVVIQP